jgi:hypothetical protein
VSSVGVEGEFGATRANVGKGAQESGIKGWIPLRDWREVLCDLINCGVRAFSLQMVKLEERNLGSIWGHQVYVCRMSKHIRGIYRLISR